MTTPPAESGRARARRAKRARTPAIRQAQPADCGPTALAIILAYHGCVVSVERLRVECGLSRDGTNARDLVQSARAYGLTTGALSITPARLDAVSFPCIAAWADQHFVVIEGCTPAFVFLNDPATGPRTIACEQFARDFRGAVLTFAPGESFSRQTLATGVAQRVRALVGTHRASLAFVAIASLALVITSAVIPLFAQVYIDRVIGQGEPSRLAPLLIVLLLMTIAGGVSAYLQQDVLIRVDARLVLAHGRQAVWSILRLPLEVVTRRSAGDLATCVDSAERFAGFLSRTVLKYSVDAMLVATYALLMLLYSPVLSLAVAVCGLLNVWLLHRMSRRLAARHAEALARRGQADGLSASYLRSIETIKSSGVEAQYFDTWAGFHAAAINARQTLAGASLWLAIVPPFFSALAGVAVVVIGGRQIIDGLLTVGMLVAFQGLLHNVQGPLATVIALQGDVQQAAADLVRLGEVAPVARPTAMREAASSASASDTSDSLLALDRVAYGFSRTKRPFIDDCTLRVGRRGRVAIVGRSGSGKSTVARLAAGLYEPWSGRVVLAGCTRQDASHESGARTVAIVDNASFFFKGRLRDNLTLWDPSLSDETVWAACRDAEIEDCVRAMGGLDAILAEGANTLSGGQRQRLEIARALACGPALLILDEATSALDAPCEARILRNITRRGGAWLMITHRLSAIRDCDEILVMDRGAIVERGTHDALIAAKGAYDALLNGRSAVCA